MNGMQLILKEREEQKTKHGYTKAHDAKYNKDMQLMKASAYLVASAGFLKPLQNGHSDWPADWSTEVKERIDKKSPKEKLIIAGALAVAEFERTGEFSAMGVAKNMADHIDNLIEKEKGPLQRVTAVQDDDGHWYVIPAGDVNEFHGMLDEAARNDDYDEFNMKFSKYLTGGDLNIIELWAKLPD